MSHEDCMTVYDCPYCHVTEARVISQSPRVVRCNVCGLHRLSPRMSPEGQQKYLEDYGARLDLADYPASLDGRDDEEVSRVARVFQQISKGGRVLDVGCAEGSFPYALRKAGARAIGLEPLGRLVEYGKGFGIDLRQGSFDQLPAELSNETFDLISFREVIYYVNDLKAAFHLTKRLLKAGGGVYIKSHVASSLYYLRNRDRTRRYGTYAQGMPTKAALERLLAWEGFKVIEWFPFPYNVAHVLGVPVASVAGRVFNKATKKLFDSLGMYDRIGILAQKA